MELPADAFGRFVDEVRLFCNAVRPRLALFGGIRITGGGLLRRPVLTRDEVNINGWPPMRAGYEPFNLTRVYSEKYGSAYRDRKPDDVGLYWDYVQTNGNAYDVVV